MASAGNKDIRRALPSGYRVIVGKKHHKILDPNGEVVRCADGRPLILSQGAKVKGWTLRKKIEELRGLS